VRSFRAILTVISFLMFCPFVSFAQTDQKKPPDKPEIHAGDNENTEPPPISGSQARHLSMLTDSELQLSLEVMVFGGVVLILEFLLLRRQSPLRAEDTLRVFGVTVILIGTLFAITAGFKSEDVAPAMGLFGTIGGYLLGKKTSTKDAKENLKPKVKTE
jgi:hypothetical protein